MLRNYVEPLKVVYKAKNKTES